jgi:hypothetical protein
MSTRRCLGPLLALTLLPAAVTGQAFEGKVTWSFEGPGAGMDLTYYMKGGDKIRMDMGEQGSMVVNGDSRIMIMPAQKMWMDMAEMEALGARMGMPTSGAGASTEPDVPDLVETGETGTFAGIECTYFRVTDGDNVSEMCAATGMGWFAGPAGQPGGRGGRAGRGGGRAGSDMGAPAGMSSEALQQWQARFANGFFPLEIRQMRGGQVMMRMWARELSQEPLGDDLFPTEGPAGYQKMSMGGIG